MDDMQFEWETLEYEHYEKSPRWFWTIGIGAVILILIAILTKNFLLAILILLAGFALILHGVKPPDKITIAVNRYGVQVRHRLYPFKTLRSFWIHDQPTQKITLRSEKALMPHLHLPFPDDLDHETLRAFLLENLPEEYHEPTLIDALVEYL
ncbi:MAG: hypothetical protein HYT47_00200 [Candidatus Vogelbacteria bacterium]|nr:hypothetical protein [Candidatus Vogelbacteria bacterium]